MKRFLPTSLAGQMALLLGLALLVAQLANFALILNERQKLGLAQSEGPAIITFATVADDYGDAAPIFRQAVIEDQSRRGARFAEAAQSGIGESERDTALETQIDAALAKAGATARSVRAARGPGTDVNPRTGRRREVPPDIQLLRIAAQQQDGKWLTARMATPRRDPLLALRLGAATLLLYLLVLGATIWIAVRIARPLRDLTRAAGRFQGRDEPIAVPSRGPGDVVRAIEAFNAMRHRVTALLDEKDHMLGAIGHDLRTPLASLRIRVESMEPREEREAAIAKIEEMTAMLEDILVLARTGRARETAREVDLAALAEALVEEYRELGQPVSFVESARQVAAVQPDLIRRALRNLIDNAVKYGGSARVSVARTADGVAVTVADEGPGIDAAERQRVLQPFQRLEGSRNRGTGGAGLGLAIASSVAESHGGRLILADNVPRGLKASILLATEPPTEA
ncbi:sensor histidine kinase [Sphingomonas crusticola]|uniref:sensor histidine kinase n=1 Tax=Sphingomonas crusticola TaxID=1697973 RepID=UPI000E242BAA|nr:HAMP domain-containing sensor histidine kinase [Sphingomonas crusticola]